MQLYIAIDHKSIDVLSYWAWRCITSFIDHAIQNVGQKDNANQLMEVNGFRRISSHCITVSSNHALSEL